jgi:hypothetical protein
VYFLITTIHSLGFNIKENLKPWLKPTGSSTVFTTPTLGKQNLLMGQPRISKIDMKITSQERNMIIPTLGLF